MLEDGNLDLAFLKVRCVSYNRQSLQKNSAQYHNHMSETQKTNILYLTQTGIHIDGMPTLPRFHFYKMKKCKTIQLRISITIETSYYILVERVAKVGGSLARNPLRICKKCGSILFMSIL